MANNIQALSAVAPNSTNPTRSYVGFTMSDAEQNPVKFTTDKTSRNVMMNGYDTGVGAQQFSSMMSNPESVSQFANAISQTSFSNVEAYNATNNILMDMNSQNQRAIMQQRVDATHFYMLKNYLNSRYDKMGHDRFELLL